MNVENEFTQTRFKHVLLPVWIAAYQYRDRTFQFLVNGQTGEVEGYAPFSVWKILAAVVVGLIFLAVLVLFYFGQQQGY